MIKTHNILNAAFTYSSNNLKIVIILVLFLDLHSNKDIFENNNNKINIRLIFSNSPLKINYGNEGIFMSTMQFLSYYFPQLEKIIIKVNDLSLNMHLIKILLIKMT